MLIRSRMRVPGKHEKCIGTGAESPTCSPRKRGRNYHGRIRTSSGCRCFKISFLKLVGHSRNNSAWFSCFALFSVASFVAAGAAGGVEIYSGRKSIIQTLTDSLILLLSLILSLMLTTQIKVSMNMNMNMMMMMMMMMMMRMMRMMMRRRRRIRFGMSLAGTQRTKSIRQDLRICQKSSLFSHPVRQECASMSGHPISVCLSKETGSKAMAPWPHLPAMERVRYRMISQHNCI